MVYSISVFGSQHSKYIFEFDKYNIFKIVKYFERVIPFKQIAVGDYFDKKITSNLDITNWRDELIIDDINGKHLEKFLSKKSDFVLFDLQYIVDEFYVRFTGGKKHYYSSFGYYKNYEPELEKEYFFDKNHMDFDKLLKEFIYEIKSKYKDGEIILLKTKIPKQYIDEQNIIDIFNEKSEEKNIFLSHVYEVFEKCFKKDGKLHIIDCEALCISDKNHPHGLSPYCFVNTYYEHIMNLLYSIVNFSFKISLSPVQTAKSKYALIINKFDNKNPIKSLGYNTGNIAYWESIRRLFEPYEITYEHARNNDLSNFEAVIITDLIWIRENQDYSYLKPIVEKYPKNIVFMSVGLQSSKIKEDFVLHQSVVDILKIVSNYRVIGTRGRYTKDILSKYGIMNAQVIGCPSMYYWNNRNLTISSDIEWPHMCLANFRSFYGNFSTNEKKLLMLFMNNNLTFIEQNSVDYGKRDAVKCFDGLYSYLEKKAVCFYNMQMWSKRINDYNCSIGMRFHANVISLINGVQSLFIVSDSRTKEMVDYFKLPYIKIEDMSKINSLDDLIDKIDYTEFNSNYPIIFDNFIDYLRKNNLKIVNKQPLDFYYEKNSIRLNKIIKKKNSDCSFTIRYEYTVKGKWQINFTSDNYEVTYSKMKRNIPDSIAVIPFLGNVLPLSWLCDADVCVNDVDLNFFKSMKYIKKSYVDMSPDEYFGGNLICNKVTDNKNKHGRKKSLLLYSGGVDATSSLINILDEKPSLMTIWGSDIFFTESDCNAWTIVSKQNKDTASMFRLKYYWCKSEFRIAVDSRSKGSWINKAIKIKDNYWHAYQHGISLITHAALFSYAYNYKHVYIASSYSSKGVAELCASAPHIDDNIRFSSSFVHHNGYGDSRLDKIIKIIDFSEENNVKFKLRVCWQTITGNNCCSCEKCVRTIYALLILNKNPCNFGFDIDDNKCVEIVEKIKTGKISLSSHFDEITRQYGKFYSGDNILVKYLIEKYSFR